MSDEIFRVKPWEILDNTAAALQPSELSWRDISACSSKEARELLGYELAEKLCALPLAIMRFEGRETLTVAVPDADDPALKNAIAFATGRELKLVSVERELLLRAVFAAYYGDAGALGAQIAALGSAQPEMLPSAQRTETPLLATSEASRLLHALLNYGLARGASDLHLVPGPQAATAYLRLDGVLHSREDGICSIATHRQMVQRVKVLSQLDTTEHSQPQDGTFATPGPGGTVYVRVSVMPTVFGEKVVLRFLGTKECIALGDLGLPEVALGFIEEFMQQRSGMLLTAGPTGSGKTTTLYSALVALKRQNISLVSIEDPVELYLPGISQTQVNVAQGLTYAAGLKGLLRQDPDAILVGEIRDPETAKLAFQAALTGHMLLSSVHAGDVFEVLLRLKCLGVDALTLAHALRVVLCQKLLPKLCEGCRVVDLNSTRAIVAGERVPVYRARGCSKCEGSGVRGRVLVVEALAIDSGLSDVIVRSDFDPVQIRAALTHHNYLSAHAVLAELTRNGVVAFAAGRP